MKAWTTETMIDVQSNIIPTLSIGNFKGTKYAFEAEVNARLIAAAPEIYSALEKITKWGEAAGLGNSKRSKQFTMFENARTVLAKVGADTTAT